MTSKKIIVSVIIFLFLTVSVSAEETLITIILPNSVLETTTEPAKPIISAPVVYPVSVTENAKGSRREIVKTYELSPHEKPSDIPRDSFERTGWLYELADITKKENVKTEEKQHTETVTLESATKDFDEVLRLLPKSKNYNIGGFTGTLTLDVSTITVEQAGSQNVGYTISETREYPYLSSNDSSFVPKTIADRYGRTLTLSSLTWREQANVAVDYAAIPESYTAVATYTGKGYKTVVTGYEITAQYRGAISRTLPDKTVYTALFIGAEIVAPVMSTGEPTMAETVTEVAETAEVPTVSESEIPAESSRETVVIIAVEPMAEVETPPETTEVSDTSELPELAETEPEKNQLNLILTVTIILCAAGFIICRVVINMKTGGKKVV